MIKTYNRRPISVNIPSSSDLKEYYASNNTFTGIINNDNFLAVDQNSFEDCCNVYVNEQGLLSSRPTLKQTTSFVDNIFDVWILGEYIVYVTNDSKLYITNNNVQLTEPIQLSDTNCKLILIQNNILIFTPTELKVFKLDTYGVYGAESIVLIPELQGKYAISQNENELTTIVKKLYDYNNDLQDIIADLLNNVVYFKLYDVTYSITINKEYDLNRLVNVYLNLEHIDKTDFEMWSASTSTGEVLAYRYGNNLKYYKDGITINIPYPSMADASDNSNIIFTLSKDGTTIVGAYSYKYDVSSNAIKFVRISAPYNKWEILEQVTDYRDNDYYKILKLFVQDLTHYTVSYQNKSDRVNNYQSLYYSINDSHGVQGGYSTYDYHDVVFVSDTVYVLFTWYASNMTGVRSFTPGSTWNILYRKNNTTGDVVNGKLYSIGSDIYWYLLIYSDSNKLVYHHLYKNNSEIYIKYNDGKQSNVIASSKISMSYDKTLNILSGHYKSIEDGNSFKVGISNKFIQYDIVSNNIVYDANWLYSAMGLPIYLTSSDKYFYYIDTFGNIISNNIKNLLQIWTISDGGYVNIYPDKIVQDDDKLYLMKDNVLYISEPYINDAGKFQLYFPKRNTETFDETITNIHKISNEEIAIFFENYIIVAKRTNVTYGEVSYNGYYYTKSKLPIGCKKYSDITTSFDGSYTIVPSKRGLAYLSYQQFVASTDQVVSYVSDNIYSIWKDYAKDAIKLYKNLYYIYCYKEKSNECLILDVRANSWFRWLFNINLTKVLDFNDETIVCNKVFYKLYFDENNYFDYDKIAGKTKIDWYLKSQKLHLNSPNNYKQVRSMTITSVLDIDTALSFNLQLINYRDNLDVSKMENIEYDVDTIRTFVQRLNFSKVMEFQYYLQNVQEYEHQVPLNISNISIKYKIGGQVR